MRTLFVMMLLAGCGDNDGLSQFYPPLPPETGAPQSAWAGPVRTAEQLLTGPGATGRVGDYYIRNNVASFIISSPSRVAGPMPHGGNLVDAALVTPTGTTPDAFGELSMVYKWGRVCEHDAVNVVRNGAGGGVAALRATGLAAANDFLNLRAVPGISAANDTIDPTYDDRILCATTYVLAPDSAQVEVYFSFYNAGYETMNAPYGIMADPGRQTFTWGTGQGFDKVDFGSLSAFTQDAAVDYAVYQSEIGAAYGVLPRTDSKSAAITVAGLSFVLFDIQRVTGILDPSQFPMHIEPRDGYLAHLDFVVGRDAEDVSRYFYNDAMTDVSGNVTWSDNTPAAGARIGVYQDVDNDGDIGVDDVIVSYLDADGMGAFDGKVPVGAMLLRAEQKNQGRSAAVTAAATTALVIPRPLRVDYTITDRATGQPVPGRVAILGGHTAFPDKRIFEVVDRAQFTVTQAFSVCGTTVGDGVCVDPPIYLPANPGGYRAYATRGTEWSYASAPVAGDADVALTLTLDHVAPTPGYVSSDWHVHHEQSYDSSVPAADRVRTAIAGAVDVFAITDHDYVTDLRSVVTAMGLEQLVHIVPGLEATPFAYGHVNGFPLTRDESANGGAIDWPRGARGFAMLPADIFGKFRTKGAQVVQVNHPRAVTAFGQLLAYFDRANLVFDTATRVIFGDYENAGTPNEWLRLPNQSIWSDQFNALEVWNGFDSTDTDGDGQLELRRLDMVMRDWFNMLSFGFIVTPTASSDTHTSHAEPLGMPRTLVRVPDDTNLGVDAPGLEEALWANMAGTVARDVVMTNGPMIEVTSGGNGVLGQILDGAAGVTLTVTVTAPQWANIDTLEVFTNQTPVVPAPSVSSLAPLMCFTSRALGSLADTDPCATAPVAPQALTKSVTNGAQHATVTFTLTAADIPPLPGGTGADAWVVVRARGNRGVFPLVLAGVDNDVLPVVLAGNAVDIANAMDGRGAPAQAITSAIFIDFDGGGFRAPFAP